jgi:IS30 family transposase
MKPITTRAELLAAQLELRTATYAKALADCDLLQRQAASLLGVHPATLQYELRRNHAVLDRARAMRSARLLAELQSFGDTEHALAA